MLSANAGTDVRTYATSLFHCHLNELAHAVLVQHLERIYCQNLLFQINRQEGSDIVARVTEGHLCQVVSTE